MFGSNQREEFRLQVPKGAPFASLMSQFIKSGDYVEAQRFAQTSLREKFDPGTLFLVARLATANGDNEGFPTRALEMHLPDALPRLLVDAGEHVDWDTWERAIRAARLRGSDDFRILPLLGRRMSYEEPPESVRRALREWVMRPRNLIGLQLALRVFECDGKQDHVDELFASVELPKVFSRLLEDEGLPPSSRILQLCIANERAALAGKRRTSFRQGITEVEEQQVWGDEDRLVEMFWPLSLLVPVHDRFARTLDLVARAYFRIWRELLARGFGIVPRLEAVHGIVANEASGIPRISYHTCALQNQVAARTVRGVRLKEHALRGYFSVDSKGYAAWSDFATKSHEDIIKQTRHVPPEKLLRFASELRRRYLTEDQTKYAQPASQLFLPRDSPRVFFPLQVPDDVVVTSQKPRVLHELVRAAKLAAQAGITAIVKPHPYDDSATTVRLLEESRQVGVRLTRAPISSILSNVDFVCVVNSGVGFEALVMGKNVISLGDSDYSVATRRVASAEEAVAAFRGNQDLDASLFRERFLWLAFQEYVCSIDEVAQRAASRIQGLA